MTASKAQSWNRLRQPVQATLFSSQMIASQHAEHQLNGLLIQVQRNHTQQSRNMTDTRRYPSQEIFSTVIWISALKRSLKLDASDLWKEQKLLWQLLS